MAQEVPDEHVRDARQGGPAFHVTLGEHRQDAPQAQFAGDQPVLIYALIIVIVDEVVADGLAEDQPHRQEQKTADGQRRVAVPQAGPQLRRVEAIQPGLAGTEQPGKALSLASRDYQPASGSSLLYGPSSLPKPFKPASNVYCTKAQWIAKETAVAAPGGEFRLHNAAAGPSTPSTRAALFCCSAKTRAFRQCSIASSIRPRPARAAPRLAWASA